MMQIVELWRYPIASMIGERLDSVEIDPAGLAGDRHFSVCCKATGEVAAPERSARWQSIPLVSACGTDRDLLIKAPGMAWLPAFDPAADAALEAHLGFAVALKRTGLWRDEPPGSGRLQPRYPRSPVHLVSRRMLTAIQEAVPDQTMSAQRFRANIVLDVDESQEQEVFQVGAKLHFGDVIIEITGPTQRCAFVALAQAGLCRSPMALRIIKQSYGLHFGFYGRVVQRGTLTIDIGTSENRPCR